MSRKTIDEILTEIENILYDDIYEDCEYDVYKEWEDAYYEMLHYPNEKNLTRSECLDFLKSLKEYAGV